MTSPYVLTADEAAELANAQAGTDEHTFVSIVAVPDSLDVAAGCACGAHYTLSYFDLEAKSHEVLAGLVAHLRS